MSTVTASLHSARGLCNTARRLLAVPSDTVSVLQERWTTQLNEELMAAIKAHMNDQQPSLSGGHVVKSVLRILCPRDIVAL